MQDAIFERWDYKIEGVAHIVDNVQVCALKMIKRPF